MIDGKIWSRVFEQRSSTPLFCGTMEPQSLLALAYLSHACMVRKPSSPCSPTLHAFQTEKKHIPCSGVAALH